MPREGTYRPFLIAVVALLAFALLFVIAGLNGWWEPASNEKAIGEASRWCERVSPGIMREPINSLGNLAFIVSGLVMLLVLARDTKHEKSRVNPFIGNQPIALLYAGATIYLGPGSMLMHGSNTVFGAWADNLSMVMYILIPWIYNLTIMGRWRDRTFFVTYGLVAAGFAIGYWFFGSGLGINLDLFGVSIALWLISELLYRFWSQPLRWLSGLLGFVIAAVFGITPVDILADPWAHWWVILFWLPGLAATTAPDSHRRYWPWFPAGVIAFLSAYAVWTTGVPDHHSCDPDGLFQAHALWHLLTAAATWFFFLFLRTQRPSTSDSDNSKSDSDLT